MKQRKAFGFSLIEVMIALGILSVITVGFMTMMENIQKGEKGLAASIEYIIFKSSIQLSLQRADLCLKGLQGVGFNPHSSDKFSLNEISFGSTQVKVGNLIAHGGPKISSLILKKTADPGFLNTSTKRIEYLVDFIIEVERPEDSYGAKVLSNVTNPFKMLLIVDSNSKELIACNTNLAFK